MPYYSEGNTLSRASLVTRRVIHQVAHIFYMVIRNIRTFFFRLQFRPEFIVSNLQQDIVFGVKLGYFINIVKK